MPCWVDHGAVVISAAFGDITGDFLFDTSAPKSILHVDRALEDGIETPNTQAPLRLGDNRIPATLSVASIDARSRGFDTTLNGIIGADVLAGYVVDLQLAPTCRISFWKRRAPSLKAVARMPLKLIGGVPTFSAAITDGHTGLTDPIALDTGAAGVRLPETVARLSRPPKGDPTSRLHPPARLAALSVGGAVYANQPMSLATDLPEGVIGAVGTRVWSHYLVRLDFRRGELELASPPSILLPLREKVAVGDRRMRGRAKSRD